MSTETGGRDTGTDERIGQALESFAGGTSRRGLLARAGAALLAATAGGSMARFVKPGEADAFHFCGHIWTTGSCPHPTGRRLPRVDAAGWPLRPDGKPVDDLGRRINKRGIPVDEDGRAMRDPDGRPMPPAPRTKVCDRVSEQFGMRTWVDGAWYRCCGGQVRKLVDCCSRSGTRINGDEALTGYCYKGRTVFCVMYFQTKVPC